MWLKVKAKSRDMDGGNHKNESTKGIGNSLKLINSCHMILVLKIISLKMVSKKCLLLRDLFFFR